MEENKINKLDESKLYIDDLPENFDKDEKLTELKYNFRKFHKNMFFKVKSFVSNTLHFLSKKNKHNESFYDQTETKPNGKNWYNIFNIKKHYLDNRKSIIFVGGLIFIFALIGILSFAFVKSTTVKFALVGVFFGIGLIFAYFGYRLYNENIRLLKEKKDYLLNFVFYTLQKSIKEEQNQSTIELLSKEIENLSVTELNKGNLKHSLGYFFEHQLNNFKPFLNPIKSTFDYRFITNISKLHRISSVCKQKTIIGIIQNFELSNDKSLLKNYIVDKDQNDSLTNKKDNNSKEINKEKNLNKNEDYIKFKQNDDTKIKNNFLAIKIKLKEEEALQKDFVFSLINGIKDFKFNSNLKKIDLDQGDVYNKFEYYFGTIRSNSEQKFNWFFSKELCEKFIWYAEKIKYFSLLKYKNDYIDEITSDDLKNNLLLIELDKEKSLNIISKLYNTAFQFLPSKKLIIAELLKKETNYFKVPLSNLQFVSDTVILDIILNLFNSWNLLKDYILIFQILSATLVKNKNIEEDIEF